MSEKSDILEVKRKNSTWRSELFLAALSDYDTESLLREGYEFSKRYKVLELYVVSGRIISKVQSELTNPVRIEISLAQFRSDVWENSFEALCDSAALYSCLLAKQFPEELNVLLERNGLELFPKSSTDLSLQLDGNSATFNDKQVAATLCRLVDKLDTDPFAMFVLRGMSYEDALLTVRKIRARVRPQMQEVGSSNNHTLSNQPVKPLIEQIQNFWTFSTILQTISYNLKADELPASLLKRLDPMPLGGLEDEVDRLFQDAYAHVATRAQAFGLGL